MKLSANELNKEGELSVITIGNCEVAFSLQDEHCRLLAAVTGNEIKNDDTLTVGDLGDIYVKLWQLNNYLNYGSGKSFYELQKFIGTCWTNNHIILVQ